MHSPIHGNSTSYFAYVILSFVLFSAIIVSPNECRLPDKQVPNPKLESLSSIPKIIYGRQGEARQCRAPAFAAKMLLSLKYLCFAIESHAFDDVFASRSLRSKEMKAIKRDLGSEWTRVAPRLTQSESRRKVATLDSRAGRRVIGHVIGRRAVFSLITYSSSLIVMEPQIYLSHNYLLAPYSNVQANTLRTRVRTDTRKRRRATK
ncbi:hypothetical protein DFH05DRAFT_859528 [Lentinula detonsa]|uniref:Uncharacterized protein n=1 Tax=Lentinula detonsa TaxID=2804962 RepID=A0A9W8P6F6_9AGAR|nr:hypothetical protein DFH05DRAFT_859528 [Lentinula detonsa]